MPESLLDETNPETNPKENAEELVHHFYVGALLVIILALDKLFICLRNLLFYIKLHFAVKPHFWMHFIHLFRHRVFRFVALLLRFLLRLIIFLSWLTYHILFSALFLLCLFLFVVALFEFLVNLVAQLKTLYIIVREIFFVIQSSLTEVKVYVKQLDKSRDDHKDDQQQVVFIVILKLGKAAPNFNIYSVSVLQGPAENSYMIHGNN